MDEPTKDGESAAPVAAAPTAERATDDDFADKDEYEYYEDEDEDVPPVDDPMQEIEFVAAQGVFMQPSRAQDKPWLLLIMLLLFVGASMLQGGDTLTELAILIGVLLLHELGHALAMLAVRYTDVRVFFIPLFGAGASVRRYDVARWKQGVVLMMGPLPGLVLGCVLLLRGDDGLVRTVALQLVAINAFNLLPVAPFDGGPLFHLVLFSRHPQLETRVLMVASLAVIGLAFVLGTWIFGVVGLFMLLSIPGRNQVLAGANELRSEHLPVDPRELDEPQRRRVFAVLWKLMPGTWRGRPPQQAALMAQVHESASQRPLSVDASVGIGALWVVGAAITAFAVSTVIDARATHDPPPPPAQWQRYHDTAGTFTIELPAQPVESPTPEPNLIAMYGNRHYGVLWKPVTDEAKWNNFEAAVTKDATLVRRLSIPDSVGAFVMKNKQGMYVTMRIVRRGPIGYLVVGGAFVDNPDAERVVRSFRLEPAPP